MRFGLTSKQLQIVEEKLINPLAIYKVKVYVFGSRARGDHHPYSDLDLLMVEDSANQVPNSMLSKIKEDLEESSLPFKVDIVKDSSLASSYRSSVEKDKMRWSL